MYVVYGYDVASTENVFWKDFQNTSVTGACLHLDILPFAAIPLISAERTDVYVTPINWGRNIVPSVTRLLLEAVSTICH